MRLQDFDTFGRTQLVIESLEVERGHDIDSVILKSLILMEEMGELAKAIREKEGIEIHDMSERYSVADELADCLFVLVSIANRYEVNLQVALYNKIRKDEGKTYNKGL